VVVVASVVVVAAVVSVGSSLPPHAAAMMASTTSPINKRHPFRLRLKVSLLHVGKNYKPGFLPGIGHAAGYLDPLLIATVMAAPLGIPRAEQS